MSEDQSKLRKSNMTFAKISKWIYWVYYQYHCNTGWQNSTLPHQTKQ